MVKSISPTWRDFHDLESFARDFECFTTMDANDEEKKVLRTKLARQWGLLSGPVFAVRGGRGIVMGGTLMTPDVVDTAINDPAHMEYQTAVSSARAHVNLAIGAMV